MDREQQQKIVAASGKGRTISQLLSNNVFPSSIFCFMAYTYIHTYIEMEESLYTSLSVWKVCLNFSSTTFVVVVVAVPK